MWLIAAAALSAAGALWPIPTLTAVGALSALAVAVVAPRAMVGLTVLGILFVRPLEHLLPFEQLGYLDEGLVAVCALVLPLRRLFNGGRLRSFPGQWWFAAFVTIGVLSGLLLHVDPSVFLLGAFVIGKGLVLAWVVAQVDWRERHVVTTARAGMAVIMVCVAATVVNLAMPAAWNAVMASDANAVEPRSVLPSLIGPFTHPIDLGQFMALSTIAIATWRTAVRRSALTLWMMVATAGGALLTARRTAIASLLAAWLSVRLKARSTAVLLALAAATPLALVILAGPLTTVVASTYTDYLGTGTPEARTVLTVDSFNVAADHFPAGAGFGRFGSAVAASNYSPEYVERGYQEVWGLGRTAEDGRFLTDTEWPAIIGETGFFGAAAFALGLLGIYRAASRRWSAPGPPVIRWTGLAVIGWLVAILVQSIATVSFTGPPVYGLFFGLVGVLAALSDPPDVSECGSESMTDHPHEGPSSGAVPGSRNEHDQRRSTPAAVNRLRVSRTRSA